MVQGPTVANKTDGVDGGSHTHHKQLAYQSKQPACVILKGVHTAV